MNNLKIAAAVAMALGGVAATQAAFAAAPTATQCATPNDSLYVAGSSAAQPSFATALATDLFDTNGETAIAAPAITGSANGNFKAYCGFAKAGNGAGITTGDVVTVYYRAEGGSVVGALPLVSPAHSIEFLDLQPTSCQTTSPTVLGLSANVGTTDGWTGCVSKHAVEMGVTDLEPTQFTPPNYPSAYSTTVFGSATKAQLGALTSTRLFQQVFGLFANLPSAVNLSRSSAANILNGNYSDWSAVPAFGGGTVTGSSETITLVNREAGSGTRTGASIYFLGTNCIDSPDSLSDPNPTTDGYATGDVLTTANATAGAITYASIDNYNTTKYPNLKLVSLSGVAPSNLSATSGDYDWWFEATAQKGTITSPGGTSLYNWLVGGELATLASAPHAADILAIPNVLTGVNAPVVPVTGTGGFSGTGSTEIYINPYTKGGNSCSIPGETN
jgi:ABC-type phosphate transport system substrate-binding protein